MTATLPPLRADGGLCVMRGLPANRTSTAGCPRIRGVDGRPMGPTGAVPSGSDDRGVVGRPFDDCGRCSDACLENRPPLPANAKWNVQLFRCKLNYMELERVPLLYPNVILLMKGETTPEK